MNRGKLIILEGPVGSGKSTQAKILVQKLQAANLSVKLFAYPDIANNLISRSINRMVDNPDYDLTQASKVFLDSINSSQTMKTIDQSLIDGIYCICEGSYISTIVKHCYLNNIDNYEDIISIMSFANMGIAADLTIIFDAPPKILIDRSKVDDNLADISIDDIEKIRTGYLLEAKNHDFPIIFTTDTVELISEVVWEKVSKCLSVRRQRSAASQVSQLTALSDILDYKSELLSLASPILENQPYISTKNGTKVITTSGKNFLDSIITDTTGDIYAFKDKLSSVTIAAAMARLSRRGDDLRITLLDEFSEQTGADQKLLKRIISEYGDDSVQQLSGHHLVIEGASNLLSKKIEWGRLAAYLEQSTRYIHFDKKNSQGKYEYFIPKDLDAATKKNYRQTLDKIYANYSYIVNELTKFLNKTSKVPLKERDIAWKLAIKAQACDAARMVLPVAAKSTVGVFGSAQAIENMIMRLMSDELVEVRNTGKKILDNMRQVAPVFYERADDPMKGGASIAYRVDTALATKKLSQKMIKNGFSSNLDAVTLVDYYPKNEIELVPHMLYEYTDLSLAELRTQVGKWSYKDKTDLFEQYVGNRLNRRHKPGRALEIARYSWDLICDYGIFRDLQRHRIVDNLVWQDLTPRYGYETPNIIEKANLVNEYEECFDLSVKLYSQMRLKGFDKQSQYVTLLGHKMRWQVTFNAREALHMFELRSSTQGHPGYRKLILEMFQKLEEVHPIIAKSMKFINTDEDPELTRLAAERYKQLKIKNII